MARSRGIYPKDYAVLARTNDCAVLVECGFISNKTETSYYATPEGQQALAEALADGILRVKPIVNNDPPECEDAKCAIYAMKAAAAQRRLALGGRNPGESSDVHPAVDTAPQLASAHVRGVKDIMAAFEERSGAE